jgi:aminoglycoside phosphotransferase (APT) family kinase protein
MTTEPPVASTPSRSHFAALRRALTAALRRRDLTDGPAVLSARRNAYETTFAADIVSCRLKGGAEVRIFCKRGAGAGYDSCGHKGGVVYEAEVYRRILRFSRLSLPRYFGCHRHDGRETWLFIEYLDDGVRWKKTVDPWENARRLARWIGQFHAEQEALVARSALPSIRQHDQRYYRNWVRRTHRFARPAWQDFPWLAGLCKRAARALPWLLESPRTVIHGELFPQNVLVRDRTVYPIDWESAAIAAGELDLTSMTDNWPTEHAASCEEQYVLTRWPRGAPAAFGRTLDAARLFHQFRWLGDRAERTVGFARWRFEHLRRAGERLGLI